VFLAVLLGLAGAGASAGPDEDGVDLAAQGRAYLAAIAGDGEAQALEALQAGDADPWVVVEDLLLLGEQGVAARLAAAEWSADDTALRAYVARAAPGAQALARHAAWAAARLAAGDAKAALEPPPGSLSGGLTVTDVRALETQAAALDAEQRGQEAVAVRNRLARRAAAIGWRRAEAAAQRALLARLGEGDSPDAQIRILSRLLAIDQDARDLERSARWCLRLGHLEAQKEDAPMARRWLMEAESLLEVLAKSPGLSAELQQERARGLARLAHVHLTLGAQADGIDAAFRAHDMAAALPPALRVVTSRTLAEALASLMRLDEALPYMQQAYDLSATAAAGVHVRVQGDLAFLLLRLGRSEEARRLYDGVLASAEARQDRRTSYVARLHVANAYIEVPAEQRTVLELQRALLDMLDVIQELEGEPAGFAARAEIEANAKALAGRALNLLERPQEAGPLLRQALQSDYAHGRPGFRQYLQRELAHAVRLQGDAKEALALTHAAVEALREDVEALPASYALSVLSPPSVGDLVAEHVASALALGAPQEVLTALEETRGMAFLSEVRRRRRRGANAALSRQPDSVGTLAGGVSQAAQAYWRAVAQGRRSVISQARKSLWERRQELRSARGRDEVDEVRAERDAGLTPTSLPWRRVSALEPGEAMLYLARAQGEYVALLEAADRLHVLRLGKQADVEARVASARASWLDDVAAEHAPALGRMVATALPPELAAHIVARPAKDGRAVEHVYVSASGPLAQLPWPVLVQEACRGAAPEATSWPTVSLVASQGVLAHLRTWNRGAHGGALLAVGDPDYTAAGDSRTRMAIFGRTLGRLESSGAEVKALVDEARGDLRLLGRDANESMLRRCLFDAPYPFDVLHLACHGILYAGAPWMSALALHATPADDGLLTVEEVGQWQFHGGPGLVVLSACESGLGAPVPGEGEEGLVRAFMLAGARHVVASFWKVPDDTSRALMIAFHKHLRQDGMTPAAALRRSQEEVRNAAEGSARYPHAWAGWAVWGPRD